MSKKKKRCSLCIVLIILFLLVSCQRPSSIISKYSHDKNIITVLEKEATYQRTIMVFHDKGIVSKMKIIDEFIFNLEDIKLLKNYDKMNKLTYEGEIFDFNGFNQSSQMLKNMLTNTIILDYEIMDMKTLCKEENWFVHANDIVNSDFKVDFDKLEKIIIEDGYKIIEGEVIK